MSSDGPHGLSAVPAHSVRTAPALPPHFFRGVSEVFPGCLRGVSEVFPRARVWGAPGAEVLPNPITARKILPRVRGVAWGDFCRRHMCFWTESRARAPRGRVVNGKW